MKKHLLSIILSSTVLVSGFFIIYQASEIKANVITGENSVNKTTLSYIYKLKNRDSKKVEKEIKDTQKTINGNKSDSFADDLSKVKTYFAKDVFMGDSITEPISYYQLLNNNNVVAEKGRNVHSALNDINSLYKDNPKKVFMLYGMNDLLIYKDAERFQKEYQKLISTFHQKLPKAKLYIQSILPVSEAVQKKTPGFALDRVKAFNKVLKKMCKKNKAKFIDIRKLIESDSIYEPDGIHLKIDFYKKLLVYIMKRNY